MSNDTLLRVVRRRIRLPSDPLRVVGIDDWAWRRNHRYASIVCNLERRRARVAAYEASPEARARERISNLTTLGYSRRLSAAEKAELESLESLYPRLPPHPDHPGASSFAKFGEALKRLKEESRLQDEERRQARERRASLKSEAATLGPDDGFQEFLD